MRGRNSKVTIYIAAGETFKSFCWGIVFGVFWPSSGSVCSRENIIDCCQVVRIWQNITRSAASKRLNEKQQRLDEFLNFEVKKVTTVCHLFYPKCYYVIIIIATINRCNTSKSWAIWWHSSRRWPSLSKSKHFNSHFPLFIIQVPNRANGWASLRRKIINIIIISVFMWCIATTHCHNYDHHSSGTQSTQYQCLRLFLKEETRWWRAACLRYTGASHHHEHHHHNHHHKHHHKHHLDRLHKEVICPGLRENLHKAEEMMEMFEGQAERIKTVYTKYLSDHMKVITILKNESMKVSRFPILWGLTLCTSRSLQSMQTSRSVLTASSMNQTCIWLDTISSLKHWSRWLKKVKHRFIGDNIKQYWNGHWTSHLKLGRLGTWVLSVMWHVLHLSCDKYYIYHLLFVICHVTSITFVCLLCVLRLVNWTEWKCQCPTVHG